MEEMNIQGIPVLNVYNKMDKAQDFVPTLAPAVQLSIKSEEVGKDSSIYSHFLYPKSSLLLY
ncbi:hypothetical protein JVW19_21980, partial [Vibrio cholerae O1]|nr:hypothetical protein [Vibrio cholerae O1]